MVDRKWLFVVLASVSIVFVLTSVYSQTRKNTNSNTNDGITIITRNSSSGSRDCSKKKSTKTDCQVNRRSNRNRNSNSNYDSPAELVLERFKDLQGVWIGEDEQGRENKVVFKRIAKGAYSIRNAFSNMPGALTMFYLDDDRELLSNCCSINNQLQRLSTSFSTNEIALTLTSTKDGSDLSSSGSLIFRILDNETLVLQRYSRQDGQLVLVDRLELKRANPIQEFSIN